MKLNQDIISKLLKPETMKLLGSTRNKITKDKNGWNVHHLETAEVILIYRNLVNSIYQ